MVSTVEMSKDRYSDLMLRFAKELHEVGVTENMKKLTEDKFKRTPNSACCESEEDVRKFHYRYDGYVIEATQSVRLVLKKCK